MGEWGKPKLVNSSRISRNTINLWLQRRKETGDFRAYEGYQQGYGGKVNDLEKFREFVRKHGSQTQEEIAETQEGDISDLTIGKALKKIGFTRQKTYGYRERDPEERKAFILGISQKEQEKRVYVDELGIDNREDYGYGWN